MRNCTKTVINFSSVVVCAFFVSGCATVQSSIASTDPNLITHHYDAPYEKVLNATAESASKVSDWKVDDVDKSLGIVTVMDSNTWGSYIIKIKVKKISDNRMLVDITSRMDGYRPATNKKLGLFYEILDNTIGKTKDA